LWGRGERGGGRGGAGGEDGRCALARIAPSRWENGGGRLRRIVVWRVAGGHAATHVAGNCITIDLCIRPTHTQDMAASDPTEGHAEVDEDHECVAVVRKTQAVWRSPGVAGGTAGIFARAFPLTIWNSLTRRPVRFVPREGNRACGEGGGG
jgi:hypothetical protein